MDSIRRQAKEALSKLAKKRERRYTRNDIMAMLESQQRDEIVSLMDDEDFGEAEQHDLGVRHEFERKAWEDTLSWW